ncbi:LOW QUALITY PROTEIN: B box and SPRY domain-containing protein-like [Xyrauchen texanus]|uniref:LOW QUALITY PROTEIN: B box and SPRY domain-containing protein-like n=1 Tax=Xyrauchen texanus TaxID=154827 RepID=UPI0022427B1B|nr:LOW QUALITY PROTEIN: B box and SPRY domain-containing protein-like [Xyrauchen texanus]
MSAEYRHCELAQVFLRVCDQMETDPGLDDPPKQENRQHVSEVDGQFLYSNGTANKESSKFGDSPVGDFADSSSGVSASGESKLCSKHGCELELYCSTEEKLTCSLCVSDGSCQGHTVTELVTRATIVRNQLVDICEKMQLQALRIEHFTDRTLTAREKALQTDANKARERVLAQVNVVREALEEEEQRLLEVIQREEERVEQCLLTQRAHWTQTLEKLTHTRTSLVHTLTNSTDTMLVNSNQEIFDRIEDAEGVSEPRDTEQLSLNRTCSDSKLMVGLWASAILLGPSAHSSIRLQFDMQTASSLLLLSDDQCTLTFLPKRRRQYLPDDAARFDSWPNALCSPLMSSGTHSWILDMGISTAYKVGVCYASMERKGSGNNARLGYNTKSWVLSHHNGDYSFCHDGCNVEIVVAKKPKRLGLLLDWPTQTLLFYDPDSVCVLHVVRHAFSEPLQAACAVADQSISIVH